MAQDRNLSQALSSGAPQLQLPAGAVPQPDITGQRMQVEYSDRLVGQLSQFGGVISEKKMKDAADTMRTEAAVMVNQGKSLKEIHNSDKGAALRVFGETATMQGATAQMALVQMDEMARALRQEVDENNADQMTPEQYREYAVARYQEALTAIPEGSSGRDMLASMGQKVLAQSSAYQAEKHYAYTQKAELSAYSASLFSAMQSAQDAKEKGEQTIYEQSMNDLRNRLVKPERMDEDAYAGVLTKLVQDSLRFGDPAVMEMVQEMNPMFSPEQTAAIHDAHETYLQREAQKGSLQQAMDLAKLNSMAASGAGYNAIAHEVELYNAKYQRTPLSMGATENLFNTASQAAIVRQQKAQIEQARRDNLHRGEDYKNGKSEGEKTLQAEMAAAAGTEEADQLWKISYWQNPELSSQMSATLDPTYFLNADGTPNQTAANAIAEMDKWVNLNPDKAAKMVPEDTWNAYQVVKSMTAGGTMPMGDAIQRVGSQWQNRPSPAQFNAEAKDLFAEEEFGLGRMRDYFGHLDSKDFASVQSQGEEMYKKYRSLGLSASAATDLAKQEVQRNIVRVGDKFINSNGVNVQQAFLTNDLTTLQDKAMYVLHNDKAFATEFLGSEFGWDKNVEDVEVIKTTRGPILRFVITDGAGNRRHMDLDKHFSMSIQLRYRQMQNNAPVTQQFRDDPMQNTNVSYLPTD